jgi:hypothetical protein
VGVGAAGGRGRRLWHHTRMARTVKHVLKYLLVRPGTGPGREAAETAIE